MDDSIDDLSESYSSMNIESQKDRDLAFISDRLSTTLSGITAFQQQSGNRDGSSTGDDRGRGVGSQMAFLSAGTSGSRGGIAGMGGSSSGSGTSNNWRPSGAPPNTPLGSPDYHQAFPSAGHEWDARGEGNDSIDGMILPPPVVDLSSTLKRDGGYVHGFGRQSQPGFHHQRPPTPESVNPDPTPLFPPPPPPPPHHPTTSSIQASPYYTSTQPRFYQPQVERQPFSTTGGLPTPSNSPDYSTWSTSPEQPSTRWDADQSMQQQHQEAPQSQFSLTPTTAGDWSSSNPVRAWA